MKNKNSKTQHSGFTLIEVLIALAILSIALTAIIFSTSQNIKNTLYLQNKTIATWVGTEIINSARLGILKLQSGSEPVEQEITALGQQWETHTSLVTTPNPNIQKINVDVYEKLTHMKLVHLESYVYKA